MAELVYPPVIGAVKAFWRALDLKFDFQGQENLPDEKHGGAVLAMNHISYLDFALVGTANRCTSNETLCALHGEEGDLRQ